jgi:Acyl-CoA thioesterase C-terminal domain/Acyl-CoA thioesterase N-terminal domain
MSQEHEAVYLPGPAPNRYVSTPLANAGWYDEGQHGGAFASLVVGHVEATVPTLAPMEVDRATVEIFRVIPLVELRIETEIVREGKRIQSVEARVFDPEDTLLSVATIQRLRVADLPVPADARPPSLALPAPQEVDGRVGDAWGVGERGKTMFHRHAMEVREIFGGFAEKGPGAVWMRLAKPIVAGRETTPVQRLIATADFCNGVSRALDFDRWVFMNPDLSVHITRYPLGEWVALSAESGYGDLGRGVATGTLWDTTGWLGRSTQSLYLDRIGS